MGLFKPAWASDNDEIAWKAFNKLKSQAKLERVAYESSRLAMQSEAVKKLTDQRILVSLATNKDSCTRGEAIERLTDQTVLNNIAANNNNEYYLRLKAAKRLTDQVLAQKIFVELVEKNVTSNIRIEAAEHLKDQTLAQ